MSTTNNAFNYVFNTASEDHKVSKVLSGWKPTKRVPITDLKPFDAHTQDAIAEVQALLFTACQKLGSAKYNVSQRVLDVLTAYLILHYPLMKTIQPGGPAAKRLDACVLASSRTLAELLVWSTHLAASQVFCAEYEEEKPNDKASTETEDCRMIQHQAAVIDHFIEHAKRQDERMDMLEAKLDDSARPNRQHKRPSEELDVVTPAKKKQASLTYLHTTWYAQEPRLWNIRGQKQKKSDAKLLVAYMKLFLAQGFALKDGDASYRDDAMALGLEAEALVLVFLSKRGIHSKGASAVVKKLRTLHQAGALDDKIARYRRLLAGGAIADPVPLYTQNLLESSAVNEQV